MSSRSIQITGDKSDGRLSADVDQTNEALVVIDEIHKNIHRGILFQADHFDAALANDGTIVVLVQVAASLSAHMRFGIAGGGDSEIELYEGPTFSAAGTSIVPMNRNRFSPTSAVTTVTHTPTTSADGVELGHIYLPGGTGPAQSPGEQGRSFAEWILKTSEDYLFRITNRSGAVQPFSVSLEFYEPTT